MNAEPYFVRDDATVRDAVLVLVQRKTGGVPVVDAEGTVVGFVTDGGIMKYVGRGCPHCSTPPTCSTSPPRARPTTSASTSCSAWA